MMSRMLIRDSRLSWRSPSNRRRQSKANDENETEQGLQDHLIVFHRCTSVASYLISDVIVRQTPSMLLTRSKRKGIDSNTPGNDQQL